MAQSGWRAESYPQTSHSNESEDGGDSLLRNGESLSSDSEVSQKPASNHSLRIPNDDRTVRSIYINPVRTVPRAHAMTDLKLPERFSRLKEEQQAGAMVALRQVDATMRQAVIDEWAVRCDKNAVRNPAGYLFGIIQRAIKGEFNALAGERQSARTVPPPQPIEPPAPSPTTVSPEVARQHLARLREMMANKA
jgi:hypothetical protein